MVNMVKPTVGGSTGTWGAQVNTALDALNNGKLDTTTATTTYAPLVDTALAPAQQTVRVNEVPLSVLRYGAVGNGTTDDTAAVQAWATDIATNGWAGHVPRGTYKLLGTINVPKRPSWSMVGEGKRTSTFVQHTDNVPIFDLGAVAGTELHSWLMSDLGFDYLNAQPATNLLAVPLRFSAMAYQSAMHRLCFLRGSYAIKVAAGIGRPWGQTWDDLNFEAGLTLGAINFTDGINATPNNRFGRMLADCANMTGPVFSLRGYGFVIDTIEFINSYQGPVLITFMAGSEVTIGAIKIENGTYAATQKLVDFVSTARGSIGQVFVGGTVFTVTGAATKLYAVSGGGGGSGGWVNVDILDLNAASFTGGAVGYASNTGNSVPVGIGYAALNNGWALCDQGSSVSSETTTVRDHIKGHLLTSGDANYTATLGSANKVRFATLFTAPRTVDLPAVNNNLFNGLYYEFIFDGAINGANTAAIQCNGVVKRTQTTDKAVVGFTYQRHPSAAQTGWVLTKYETLP